MVLAEQQGNQNMQVALHITIMVIGDKTSGQNSSRTYFTALFPRVKFLSFAGMTSELR